MAAAATRSKVAVRMLDGLGCCGWSLGGLASQQRPPHTQRGRGGETADPTRGTLVSFPSPPLAHLPSPLPSSLLCTPPWAVTAPSPRATPQAPPQSLHRPAQRVPGPLGQVAQARPPSPQGLLRAAMRAQVRQGRQEPGPPLSLPFRVQHLVMCAQRGGARGGWGCGETLWRGLQWVPSCGDGRA